MLRQNSHATCNNNKRALWGAKTNQRPTSKNNQEDAISSQNSIGISEQHYEDSKETPMHGSGQGSGSSAPIWMFISSIIMDCFEDVAQVMTMTNINENKRIVRQCIEGYVDDTSIFTSLTEKKGHTPPPKEVAKKIQEDAQIWTELLAATGGKLK
jgi:hypothetical protein